MAYATGTATSPTNLLQSIVTFLVANGWTQNMSQAEGTGWRAHLSKGSTYVNFRAANNENVIAGGSSNPTGYHIAMYVGTGYNGASAWQAQAGGPVNSGGSTIQAMAMPLVNAGPYLSYYLFSDAADNVEIVLERAAGMFVHLGWGQLEKAGSWTGGAFFHATCNGYWAPYTAAENGLSYSSLCPGCYETTGTSPGGYVRADVDTFTGKWITICGSSNYGYTGKLGASSAKGTNHDPDSRIAGHGSLWENLQTSAMNGVANLLPVQWWAVRDDNGVSLLGNLPLVRRTNATAKGFSIGQEIVVGSDTWKLFPNFAVRKVA